MVKSVRHLLVIGAAVALAPVGSAAAAGPDADTVRDEAHNAAELVAEEFALLEAGDDGRLAAVDAAGVESLDRLRALGVELTPAIETALGALPEPGAPGAVSRTPQPVVYTAALADLDRIAATTPERRESASDLFFVAAMALLVLAGTAVANTLWRRSDERDEEELAWSDDVTGLANRRRLDHDVADGTDSTAVILVDIDDFDSIRHRDRDAADEVLCRIATILGAYVRYDDVVYRYGTSSFCVLLPEADDADAHTVSDRIVRAARRITRPNGSRVTVSVGVARTEGIGVPEALDTADRAVDRARRDGSDRAVHADERDVVSA